MGTGRRALGDTRPQQGIVSAHSLALRSEKGVRGDAELVRRTWAACDGADHAGWRLFPNWCRLESPRLSIAPRPAVRHGAIAFWPLLPVGPNAVRKHFFISLGSISCRASSKNSRTRLNQHMERLQQFWRTV